MSILGASITAHETVSGRKEERKMEEVIVEFNAVYNKKEWFLIIWCNFFIYDIFEKWQLAIFWTLSKRAALNLS